MWTTTIRVGILTLAVLLTEPARGWDFTYSYNNVTATNADTYIVSRQNVRKYVEWQDPPETYWGAPVSGMPGALTMRFDFPAPTTEIYLKAVLLSANHGPYYGTTSLWASRDGSSWQLLLDNPTPSEVSSAKVYAQNLPESLLGTNALWVQARVQQWNSPPAVSDAQFGRNDPSDSESVFELKAKYSKAGLQFASHPASAAGASDTRGGWALGCALLALAVALVAVMCALAALICVLVRLNRSPKPVAEPTSSQQLAALDQRLRRVEQALPAPPRR